MSDPDNPPLAALRRAVSHYHTNGEGGVEVNFNPAALEAMDLWSRLCDISSPPRRPEPGPEAHGRGRRSAAHPPGRTGRRL